MFTDTINRQAFEFTCKAEETAKIIQHEIEAHTAAQINRIISSIFAGAVQNNNYLDIDKLEIDLGDITVNDFGNKEMLSRLQEILLQKITGIQHGLIYAGADNRNHGAPVLSEIQKELEVIRSFILSGDVPWWFDKNNILNVDSITRRIIDLNPQPLQRFIEEHMANPDVISRLSTHLQPGTISKIIELIPGLSQTPLAERFFDKSIHVEIDSFSSAQIKKLSEIFNRKNAYASINKIRQMLISRLVQLRKLVRVKKIPVEGTALERLLLKRNVKQLLSFISSSKNLHPTGEREEKKELEAAVNRLSVFQAELLFFELSNYPAADSLFFDNDLNNPTEDLFKKPGAVVHPAELGRHYDSPEPFDTTTTGDTVKPEARVDSQVSISVENRNDSGAANIATYINKEDERKPGFEQPDKQKLFIGDSPDIGSGELKGLQDIGATNDNSGVTSDNSGATIDNSEATTHTSGATSDTLGATSDTSGATSDNLSNYSPGNKEQLPGFTPPDKLSWLQTKKEDQRAGKMIAFIMKRLKTADVLLMHYLRQLKQEHLEHISGIFKRRDSENTERRQMVDDLLAHPHLMKHDVVRVFANLEFKNEQKPGPGLDPLMNSQPGKKYKEGGIAAKLTSLQSTFLTIIKQLPPNEFIVLKDIFQKGSFDTQNEMRLVKKTLLKLQDEHIMLLKFLTELSQDEIEKLLPSAKEIIIQKNKPRGNEGDLFYTDTEKQKIYIENAGLCLLAIYLPAFFKQLGYLENNIFRNKGIATRAVYILQYLTLGKNKSPEYVLQFNKLLCGLSVDDYITNRVRLTKKEIFEADLLLESIIENWTVLKNTSLNGLRGSFLKRKGILFENGQRWTLQVERKGYDMLLNTIAWNYSMIKLPWMNTFINIEW